MNSTQLTTHFSRDEFKCKCGNCDNDGVDIELLEVMERVRFHFQNAVRIHCGNRCLEHNRKLGSKDTSQHTKSKACDFNVDNIQHIEVFQYVNSILEHGAVGIYDWGIHVDVRQGNKKNWDNRS